MSDLTKVFRDNAERLAELGSWQEGAAEKLLDRIPDPNGEQPAPGMDAGLACAMNIVPRSKWPLLAVLHARPTPEAIEQVRREVADGLQPDSETCWWLAGCSVCEEGSVTWTKFLDQVAEMNRLVKDPFARHAAAEMQWVRMQRESFELETLDGIPYGTADGTMHVAYMAGYPVAVMWAESYGIFFVGTFEESLGLEDFDWSDEVDDQNRPNSGPVHGSSQFVKCASRDELDRALAVVREEFGL